MALAYKFFRYYFAQDGDVAAIPDAIQGDGSVSYDQGFGPDYSLDPDTDPDAKDVPRDKSNQLYQDITKAIQWFQTNGAPQWIAAADNGAVSYSYRKGALAVYTDGVVYVSLVNANTATPGTDATKWAALVTGAASGSGWWDIPGTNLRECVASYSIGIGTFSNVSPPCTGGSGTVSYPCSFGSIIDIQATPSVSTNTASCSVAVVRPGGLSSCTLFVTDSSTAGVAAGTIRVIGTRP